MRKTFLSLIIGFTLMTLASGCTPSEDSVGNGEEFFPAEAASQGNVPVSDSGWVEVSEVQSSIPELTVNGSAVEWHQTDWLFEDGRLQHEEKPQDFATVPKLTVAGETLTFRISSHIPPANLFVDVHEGAISESIDPESPHTTYQPMDEGKLRFDDTSVSFDLPITPGKPLILNVYCSYYAPPESHQERWTNEVNWPVLINQVES